MKRKFINLSLLIIFTTLIIGCCEECETENENLRTQLIESKKSNQDIVDAISNNLSERYEIFRNIKLPVFLGEKRNGLNQHLHIEGGIENPFFIIGRFNSKISEDSQNCAINSLEIEIITTRSSGATITSYEFDSTQAIKLYKENDTLKMKFSVKEGSKNKIAQVRIEESAKKVINGEIMDITVTKTFPYKSNDIKLGDEDYQIKCCEPVICKSIINFP